MCGTDANLAAPRMSVCCCIAIEELRGDAGTGCCCPSRQDRMCDTDVGYGAASVRMSGTDVLYGATPVLNLIEGIGTWGTVRDHARYRTARAWKIYADPE